MLGEPLQRSQRMSQWRTVSIGGLLCAALVTALIACLGCSWFAADHEQARESLTARSATEHASGVTVGQIEDQRKLLDASVWHQEVDAQRYEGYFVRLWDQLRASKQPLLDLGSVVFQSIKIAELGDPSEVHQQIDVINTQPGQTLTPDEWKQLVGRLAVRLQLVQSEWHHERFEQAADGPQSTISMTLHIVDKQNDDRLIVKGLLKVHWSAEAVIPAKIDASRITMWRRAGPAPFRLAATLPAGARGATDFLAAYDLNGDGLSEIVFGNQVFRNLGGGNFSAEQLCRWRNSPLQSAVLADFNSDGRTDLLCADPHEVPRVYLADQQGRFSAQPRLIDGVEPITDFSTSITAGDVNGDGNLDVWLTQYKPPYKHGQMPTPYYDANDGHASYLLMGNGAGDFVEATAERGLAAKRHRRTYSSSFVDIDADDDLDLVVVSDFAGLDIYQNDGSGHFQDVSETLLDERHNFGMSHAMADFDKDTRLDLFVCGMGSTTARRLDAMQAGRSDRAADTAMRSIMGYGNRMYLWKDRFVEPQYSPQVARTGWSWGVVESDFDNDGDRDIYIGNGHISGPSARDYCSVFWRHDIYSGSSAVDPALEQLFRETQREFQSQGSWNGYEHNCLLLNQAGHGFVETAFLFGLAHEFDTRAVVADDIDADGLVDLLVVEHPQGQPARLQVWKNHGEGGNWVGVVLPEQPGRVLPGTKVIVRTTSGDQVAHVLNGDSFNCQQAATMHFGLGAVGRVTSIEVHRPGEDPKILKDPKIGQYHVVK